MEVTWKSNPYDFIECYTSVLTLSSLTFVNQTCEVICVRHQTMLFYMNCKGDTAKIFCLLTLFFREPFVTTVKVIADAMGVGIMLQFLHDALETEMDVIAAELLSHLRRQQEIQVSKMQPKHVFAATLSKSRSPLFIGLDVRPSMPNFTLQVAQV